MMTSLNPVCRIDPVSCFCDFRATVDVLRLDLLHPVVAGNKWFKLKGYLAEARNKTLLTFGGPYSNHLVATAAAAREAGVASIGIVRGEEPAVSSPSLNEAKSHGMHLFFTSRADYKNKRIPPEVYRFYEADSLYVIPEGGYGHQGMEGAKDILLSNKTTSYTHILAAVGTGTTLAGLSAAATNHQQVIGVSVMKNNHSLHEEIQNLLPADRNHCFRLLDAYHFGGYAIHNAALICFMNAFYESTGVPTDFVYTGKAFFAAFDLLRKQIIGPEDKLLLVHTGGLQGNRSLPKGTLIFD